jgi:hypothetical protein
MFSIKKFIIIFFLLIPISNSFGAMVTHNQTETVIMSNAAGGIVAGVEFNNDGTKMFTSYSQPNDGEQVIIYKNIIYLNLMISPQEFMQEIVNDVRQVVFL